MLFHEIYGVYFHVVSEILAQAVQHNLTGTKIIEIVQQRAFSESALTIPAALKKDWPFLREDLSTPLQHTPSMPLTTLQKRWLKTLLQDQRIQLFAPNPAGLEEIEPLFDWKDVVYFDQYADGDPYGDEQYIKNFRILLKAINEQRSVQILYERTAGRYRTFCCVPNYMEYSEKDDKFRVIVQEGRVVHTLNMARIESCFCLEPAKAEQIQSKKPKQCTLTFRLVDQRNALERALLHFSHFEKETVRLNNNEYEVSLMYDCEDETELLIRILSFGPMVRVVSPKRFVVLLQKRLQKQIQLLDDKPYPHSANL